MPASTEPRNGGGHRWTWPTSTGVGARWEDPTWAEPVTRPVFERAIRRLVLAVALGFAAVSLTLALSVWLVT